MFAQNTKRPEEEGEKDSSTYSGNLINPFMRVTVWVMVKEGIEGEYIVFCSVFDCIADGLVDHSYLIRWRGIWLP